MALVCSHYIYRFLLVLSGIWDDQDYFGDVRKKVDWLSKINELALYNYMISFIYSLITGNWLVFLVVFITTSSYDLVKYSFHQLGYYKNVSP
ncbi:MAG: hypothetical protein HYT48_00450 [Candidatus Vogelbacteria bacterium]|nr:hypothetical protein [Candidatus Vogelbacteria bacterium]